MWDAIRNFARALRNDSTETHGAVDGTELIPLIGASGKPVLKKKALSSILLQGGTAGLVTASLPVVVDANKDIGDFRNLDAVNFDAGASGTAGTVDVFPTTALKGKTQLKATANSGDTTNTIDNAAQTTTATWTIPDTNGSAEFVMTAAAQTVAGVKTFSSPIGMPIAAVAAAGTTAANATAMTSQRNAVTGADGVKGVALPAAATSTWYHVINTNINYPLLVYPVDGGNDNINELAEDLPITIGPREEAIFVATSATQWYCRNSGVQYARADKQVFFEDFLGTWAIGDAGPADNFSTTAGAGTATEVATTVAGSINGEVTMKSSTDDGTNAQNTTMLTGINLGYKANKGGLALEARLKIDAITVVAVFVGFTDTISTTVELPIFLLAADIDSDATDACGVGFDTDGTTAQFFHGGVAAGTDTVPAYSGGAPTAATYVTIRVEVSAAGAVRGFINGTPIGAAVAAAVTATVALTPCIAVSSRSAAARIMTIDYLRVEQNR